MEMSSLSQDPAEPADEPLTATDAAVAVADPEAVAAHASHDEPAIATPLPATIEITQDPLMRVEHDGVVYEPVPTDAALGALLFALRPGSVRAGHPRYADRLHLQLSLLTARQFERVLQRYADRADRDEPGLPPRVAVADVRDWVLRAARSVPAAEQERFCWRLAQRLGPDPWGDGSPAIELSGQQFALFRTAFAEVEGGRVVVEGAIVGDDAADDVAGEPVSEPVSEPANEPAAPVPVAEAPAAKAPKAPRARKPPKASPPPDAP